jgi:hypothetical protein
MANCIYCGKPVSDVSDRHAACEAEAKRGATAPDTPAAGSVEARAGTPVGVIACHVLGLVFLIAGLYFLVIEPGNPVADTLPDSVAGIRVVNFQRLAMGQAFTVAGAIFLAAAWRPRKR